MIVGWFVACVKPSTFAWFVSRGPASYSLTLGLIMLAMGLTLEFKDMIGLFLQRPLSVSFDFLFKMLVNILRHCVMKLHVNLGSW